MGLDAIILVFECWVSSQHFHPPLTLIKRLFSSSSLSAIRVVSSEVVDISPGSLDSSMCFIQPGISHDILCIWVKWTGLQYTALLYSFSNLEPVSCFMSSSNCCFLTRIQASQGTGKAVWYTYLLKNLLQFVVIHTVKAFSVVNEAEVDIFLELPCLLHDPTNVSNLISGSFAFSKLSLYI